jgi:hypothetical protein
MNRLSSEMVNGQRRGLLFGGVRRGLLLGGAAMLGSVQSQTVPGSLPDIVSVTDQSFAGGASNTGISSAVAAFKSAVTAVTSDSWIYLPAGAYLLDAPVSLNGKNLTFFGPGTIRTTSSSGAFTRSDHGPYTCFRGTHFIGPGDALKFVAPPTQTMFVEYLFDGCRFDNTGWGVYLDGMREGAVMNCSFDSGKGAYRVRTVNTDFISCNWKNTLYGVNDDGDRSPYSAGLKLVGGNMIGVGTGVRSIATDLVTIFGTTIDYCDTPVALYGVDGAIITGAYLTSRTASPALTIDWDPGSKDVCRAVKISDCPAILQHFVGANADSVHIAHSDDTTLKGNNINFWQRYGIFHTNNVRLTIEDNTMDPALGFGVNSIKSGAADDNSNVARNNKVAKPIDVQLMQLDRNLGYTTRSQGVSVIPSGANAITVSHGLAYVPQLHEIRITPTNSAFANARFWVDNANASTFTITTTAPVSGSASFGWTVQKAVTI